MFNINSTNIFKALLLLFIWISTNFLVNTINCDLQSLINSNQIIKHMLLYCLIYFFLCLTVDCNQSPFMICQNSFVIYILYLLLTKQTPVMFLINLLLLISIYILTIQMDYENKNNILGNSDTYNNIISDLKKITVVTLLLGIFFYYKDFNFESIDYIFSNFKCN